MQQASSNQYRYKIREQSCATVSSVAVARQGAQCGARLHRWIKVRSAGHDIPRSTRSMKVGTRRRTTVSGWSNRIGDVTCKNSLFGQIPAFLAFFTEYLHVRSFRSSAANRRHAKPRGKSAVLTLIASYRFLNPSLEAKRWTDNVPVIRYYPPRDIAFIFTFFPYFFDTMKISSIYIYVRTNKSLLVGFIS